MELSLAEGRAPEDTETDDQRLLEVLRSLGDDPGEIVQLETGYSDEDLRRLFELPATITGDDQGNDHDRDHDDPKDYNEDEDYEPPEPPSAPISKRGEVYELGPHRLGCLDALDPATWARLLVDVEGHGPKRRREKGRVDAVWSDPPYAIYGSSSGVGSGVADDKMVIPFFREILATCGRILPLFGPAYLCCDWRSWPALFDAGRRTGSTAGLEAKNVIAWLKNSGMGSNWSNSFELVSYWLNMPEALTMSHARVGGIRAVLVPNVIHESKVHASAKLHNAAKPVRLVSRILDCTEAGRTVDARPKEGRWLDVVADPFAGSGTTLIACAETGRRAILTEIEPGYCDVTRKRWGDYARAKGIDPGPGAL